MLLTWVRTLIILVNSSTSILRVRVELPIVVTREMLVSIYNYMEGSQSPDLAWCSHDTLCYAEVCKLIEGNVKLSLTVKITQA